MTRTTQPAPVDADQADADAAQGPTADHSPASPSTSALAAAVADGSVALYRVRVSGTLRRLTYLAEGTEAREVANWYAERLDEGATVKDVAAEAGVRPLAVRRSVWALELAEAIDDGDLDDLWDDCDPDETRQFIIQVSDHDYPYGETPLTDPANAGGHVVVNGDQS
ncbi:MAG: hypothetical protein QOI54_3192 [Actinomycetota bacterium]|jgi:hypothetical protein|nr:hypothetical protein [Actinomycetota bacterium]